MLDDLKEAGYNQDEALPIPFDEKILNRVIDFMRYEATVEKLPEIVKPVPSERLEDCVP